MEKRWSSESHNSEVDYHFLSRITGQSVTLTMTHGIYQGVLIHVDHGQGVLLSKVKDLATNMTKSGVHVFFAPDILNVELQKDQDSLTNKLNGHPVVERETGPSSLVTEETKDIESRETNDQVSSIQAIESAGIYRHPVAKLEVSFTVIDQLQTMFMLAISHIRCQSVIGVVPAGSSLCRHGNLGWLQVASKSHVYLFDIAILGPTIFKNGLKMVLEDRKIVKVVHDCRGLSDCLYHQYGIVLENVFDTQVADVFLFQINTGGFLPQRTSTLHECLIKHLYMEPSQISFLSLTQEIMQDNLLVWSLHPMPLPLQKALALEATYVLSLYLSMLNAMMSDFTTAVNGYLKVYAQKSEDVPRWTQFSNSKLPQEFRQLSVLQTKRKETALKVYVVDEHGLLISPGNKQEILGENHRKSGVKPQFPYDMQLVGQDLVPSTEVQTDKKETPSQGIQQFDTVTLDEHALQCRDAPYSDISVARVTSQILQEHPVWADLASVTQNLSNLQLHVQQSPMQTQVPFSSMVQYGGSRVRMSASRLLAKTTYTWSV